MEHIAEFFTYLLTNGGVWSLFGFIILLSIPLALILLIIFSWSTLGKAIDKKLASQIVLEKKAHMMGNQLRKKFSEDVIELLQGLAKETGADRALVFEYSNGSASLVGLPFLYASAAAEVTTPGTPSVSDQYQRLNLATLAGFIPRLEREGYIFIENLEEERLTYPIIYNLMHSNKVKSALFYAIQGVDEIVGFLVITTIENRSLEKRNAIHEIANAAQLVSAMWNFDELNKIVRRQNKCKWLWW